ncbi:pilin [Candidatus Nitrosacidococcus sp. I8]|uniref:pilin n=1 Tax=Candidatus Nitrosacidococcus sp. I8 TaxID=2942908 RepID=UPI002225CF14|nr:pilin [Candidatus Nitrosacidococcus sp. I8]CAH9019396.1 Fimbrial protein [Candidatus Nitrosacidococcus sp. I8]
MKPSLGFSLLEIMIGVGIVGILIAVALPQYQDYMIKAQVMSIFSQISGLKIVVAECLARNQLGDACENPVGNSDLLANINANGQVSGGAGKPLIDVNSAAGSITAQFGNHAASALTNQILTLYKTQNNNWTCAFMGDAKYTPRGCNTLNSPSQR